MASSPQTPLATAGAVSTVEEPARSGAGTLHVIEVAPMVPTMVYGRASLPRNATSSVVGERLATDICSAVWAVAWVT